MESTIAVMRSNWGVTKIGAVGYWYVFAFRNCISGIEYANEMTALEENM